MGELPPPYDPTAPRFRLEGFNLIYSLSILIKNIILAKTPDQTKGEDIWIVQDLVSNTDFIKLGYDPPTLCLKDLIFIL